MSRDNRLYLAWLVALVATLGSLYFSEVRNFVPCVLCWFQRVAMYPLAVMLGIAAFVSDYSVRRYALPLAVAGLLVAITQNLETWGVIKSIGACTRGGVSCTTPWPIWGENAALNQALTIPLLSMVAFVLIIALLSWGRQAEAEREGGLPSGEAAGFTAQRP